MKKKYETIYKYNILYVEDDELVFNFIDGCEDYRYEIDEDDMKPLVDEMWEELSPKKWEQIDEEEYDELEDMME